MRPSRTAMERFSPFCLHVLLRQAAVWLETLAVLIFFAGITAILILLRAPPWTSIAAGLVLSIVITQRAMLRYRRLRDEIISLGLCFKCGYQCEPDWTKCPECGTDIETSVRSQ